MGIALNVAREVSRLLSGTSERSAVCLADCLSEHGVFPDDGRRSRSERLSPIEGLPAQRCATLMSEARSAERMLRIVSENNAVPFGAINKAKQPKRTKRYGTNSIIHFQ
jgi:hypothetical protein